MKTILSLSALSAPLFLYILFRMLRAGTKTRPGWFSLLLFGMLLGPFLLLVAPVPLLSLNLPDWVGRLLTGLQSLATGLFMIQALLFLAACGLLVAAWLRGENREFLRFALLYAGVTLLLNPIFAVWAIAGADRLFTGTVPIEQRLISPNDAIRRRAQQDLLGLPDELKQDVSRRLMPLLEQDDPFSRKWAAIATALIGPGAHDAIPSLLQCVSAPERDVAQACRVALSEIGAPGAAQLPVLVQALRDSREEVRCEAAASIARMGPAAKDAVPVFVELLRHDARVPACLANALAGLNTLIPEGMSPVVPLLGNPSPGVRRNAAFVLSQAGGRTPEIVRALIRVLSGDEDEEVRQLAGAALTLRQTPERGEIPVLLHAMRRARDPMVRETAMQRLQELQPPLAAVQGALVEALQDESVAVRRSAAAWLVRRVDRDNPLVEPLLTMLRDPDSSIRLLAFEGFRRSGTRRRDALPAIARSQRDPLPAVRCMASEQLMEMGAFDRVAVPLLVKDLRTPDPSTECAQHALGMAGHFIGEVVPAVSRALSDKDQEVRRRAVRVFMQLGARAAPALPALMQTQRDQVPGADAALRAIREALPRPSRPRRKAP